MEKNIGLYLGTFDPFNNNHLQIIKKSLRILDKVIIQPHNDNPFIKKKHESFKHRARMLRLGLKGIKRIRIKEEKRNVYVLCKKKFRYQLIKWTKNKIKDKLWIIMGSDKLNNDMYKISSSELFKIPHVVFLRNQKDIKCKQLKYFNEIILLEGPKNISSSKIRQKIKNDSPIERYIPKKVLNYIRENILYK